MLMADDRFPRHSAQRTLVAPPGQGVSERPVLMKL